jgi:phosphatidylglycerophosphate synthase
MTLKPYNYKESVKSDLSDELVNVYLQRPIAGLVTRLAYRSPLTPNHLTIVAVLFGIGGSALLSMNPPLFTAAAVCLYVKDLFDSADGQLARAKQLYSRKGRFLDSIGDFAVNLSLYAGILILLVHQGMTLLAATAISVVGFLGVTLRVSYHVFYQTSFLHSLREYQTNRLSEELRLEDYHEDAVTVRLQRIFLYLYGWQDRLMILLDSWSRGESTTAPESSLTAWYGDATALRLSSFLGLGTEFVLMTACLLLRKIEWYLFVSIGGLNCTWMSAILYRRFVLAKKN